MEFLTLHRRARSGRNPVLSRWFRGARAILLPHSGTIRQERWSRKVIAKTRNTVTLRDVARESGFSPTTVSIVLNDAPLARYIPDETKAAIHKAVKKLGYRPNLFARSLRGQRSHTVGVMVFDMTDPYCTLILRGIENTLFQASYMPILTDVHNDRGRFERYLEMLLDRHVEALIVVANWLFVD